ncbi:MAG: AAA family ATPase [Anaerolineae bacterium]|nr:AAA family ATPase [Anaerolineae bacterium]
MTNVTLLTGYPGVGKTTVIHKIVEMLGEGEAGGFYTREVRDARSRRTGFEIVTLAGAASPLASKIETFRQTVRFKNYRVNLEALETVAVPALQAAQRAGRIIVIDEIGPMEICSKQFCDTVRDILDDESARVIGTVVRRPHRFADAVKAHPRVRLVEVTLSNRDALPGTIHAGLIGRCS